MRYVRIATREGLTFAVLDGEGTEESPFLARHIGGTPYTEPVFTGGSTPLNEARVLAPSLPSKIIVIEPGATPADAVTIMKPPTTVIGPLVPVTIPTGFSEVTCQGQVGLVIGQVCKNVSATDWTSVVRGATVAVDVTAGGDHTAGSRRIWSKSFDTLCPLGPWLDTDITGLGIEDLELSVQRRHAGAWESAGSFYTATLALTPGEAIELASRDTTLLPGDLVLTGAPPATLTYGPGDAFSVTVENLGTLENPIAVRDHD